ncbi:MAG: class II fumarate hydratase [Nitrososphaerales archaeon]
MGREYRIERDTLGEVKVPKDAYYGAQTERAKGNFEISDLKLPKEFIRALGIVKLACAKANISLGFLNEKIGKAIIKACEELIDGKFYDEFVVDVFQSGSGTSTNMNANEVIANRAIEILGGKRGDKSLVHPNDHVNMSQSTNDVFPSAIHIASLELIERELIPSMKLLYDSLRAKSEEFKNVVKAGRTHLQDAVPITLGQEFSGYASMIQHHIIRVNRAKESLIELPLGGTALGTGLNAPEGFSELAIEEINRFTKLNFRKAENTFESMQGKDACVEVSSALKGLAVSLMKISNDLRLLYSGPRTGFNEIILPALQPGSSIMPAKVNPVIPEAVNMASAYIIGNDLTIAISAQNGNLELNTMMPIIAYCLIQSIKISANSCRDLANKCIKGIIANEEVCRRYAERSLALITTIAPKIGYDKAALIAKKALEKDKSIIEILIEEGIIKKGEEKKWLDLRKLTRGGRIT